LIYSADISHSKSILIKPVIVTYNNPAVLGRSLSKLLDLGFVSSDVSVLDNGSRAEAQLEAKEIAEASNCNFIPISVNRGWGGAINYYLDNIHGSLGGETILLVMAHDSYFESLDIEEILSYFRDPNAIFVCPTYPQPVTSHYNIIKSFYSRPGKEEGLIEIGHQTAFFARASLLNQIRYDEEFWVYGGEYEIFIRAGRQGYNSYQATKTVIVNPASAASSTYGLLAYKLNSLYYAFVRHGYFGLCLRTIVVIYNISVFQLSGSGDTARLLARCLHFALRNPGRGHRSYVQNPDFQAKFKIGPLAK